MEDQRILEQSHYILIVAIINMTSDRGCIINRIVMDVLLHNQSDTSSTMDSKWYSSYTHTHTHHMSC